MYPTMAEYQLFIQNPKQFLGDAELKGGSVALNRMGLPMAASGNFAIAYRLTCGPKQYAVRLFTREVDGVAARYAAISAFLKADASGFFVPFVYLPQGILVKGAWHPAVKLEWVNGKTLGPWLEANHTDGAKVRALAEQVERLTLHMERRGFAHGDLQHGNLMVEEGGQLRVVDYDGMFVPGMQPGRGTEAGHPNYQHPARTVADFGPEMDRFPAWLIAVSLRVLAEAPGLWKTYGNDDNLLLKAADLKEAAKGAGVWAEMLRVAKCREVVERLRGACSGALSAMPRMSVMLAPPAPTIGPNAAMLGRVPAAPALPEALQVLWEGSHPMRVRLWMGKGLTVWLNGGAEREVWLVGGLVHQLSHTDAAVCGVLRVKGAVLEIAEARRQAQGEWPEDLPSLEGMEFRHEQGVYRFVYWVASGEMRQEVFDPAAIRRIKPSPAKPVAPVSVKPPVSRVVPALVVKTAPVPVVPRHSSASGAASGTAQQAGDREVHQVKGVRFDMVYCPAGRFTMGSPKNEGGRFDNEEQQEVTIARPFWIGAYPVTQGLYKAVTGENHSWFKDKPDSVLRPVEQISWFDAIIFCNKLSVIRGFSPVYEYDLGKGKVFAVKWNPKASGFRLLEEAEREYAARAGQPFRFAGSDQLKEVGWFEGNSGGETHPVGGLKANAWGIYDMSGNVWDWCWNSYEDRYKSPIKYTLSAEDTNRVFRGGSYHSSLHNARVAFRSKRPPLGRYADFSFRLARSQ